MNTLESVGLRNDAETLFGDAYAWTGDALAALRSSLEQLGFIEILPAILSERHEPGARHSIAVLGDRSLPDVTSTHDESGRRHVVVSGAECYYLPVSHCVEKQLALEHAARVYCMAPCIRLLMDGEDRTGRHLYTFFQTEIEWHTESVAEVYETVECILARFADELLNRLEQSSRLSSLVERRIRVLGETPYLRLPFAEARSRVALVGGEMNPHASGDLTHAEERALSEPASAPFWITDYPDGVRDSLYRRNPNGTFATYDLVLPFGQGELATGGLRPDSGVDILQQAAKFTSVPHDYYAKWKHRTRLQTGGIGIGVERLIRYCAGMQSVLDLRFAHDQGPNARIGHGSSLWT
jgi:asparaginyl-tRNA synthetase